MQVQLVDLVKDFGQTVAVDHVNLTIKDGALTGLLGPVSYTHLRAHETGRNLVCRLLLEKKKKEKTEKKNEKCE